MEIDVTLKKVKNLQGYFEMSNKLIISKGSKIKLELCLIDKENNLPVDLTGSTIEMMVKRDLDDLDTEAIITKVSGGDIDITTDPVNGIAFVQFNVTDTQNLKPRNYVYDVKYSDSLGETIEYIIKNETLTIKDVVNQP